MAEFVLQQTYVGPSCVTSFISTFEVLGMIGNGTFSQVLKCRNRETGQTFACKLLKRTYRDWRDVLEVKAASVLPRHPNILQLYEIHFCSDHGVPRLIYDLMDTDLSDLTRGSRKHEVLSADRVNWIMHQIVLAVGHLHKYGIIHCDLKPENIMVNLADFAIKLGDFGSVQRVTDKLPMAQYYVASRWYRSPESILTMGYYNFKIDIWSIGCIFFELLTHRVLFRGFYEIDQINKIHHILGAPPSNFLRKLLKWANDERVKHGPTVKSHRRFTSMQTTLSYLEKNWKTMSNVTDNILIRNMSVGAPNYINSWVDKNLKDNVKADAKALLFELLRYEPDQRPTTDVILRYPYFT